MHKFTQSSSLIHRSIHRNTKHPYNTVFVKCSKRGCLLSKEIDFLTLGGGEGFTLMDGLRMVVCRRRSDLKDLIQQWWLEKFKIL